MSNAAYEAILTRRVTRSMSEEPISAHDVERVLRAGRHAPNAGNRRLQPVHAVTDAAALRRLRLVSPGMFPRPAAALVICIDTGRAASFGFAPDAPGLFIDVGTSAATMLLAAHALGLASCPVTSFSRAAVDRLLGLPASVRSRMIVCLGRPAGGEPPPMGGWAGH